ncbi:MAG: hypothetical protein K6B52_05545 [Clostridiales bacterium]|nr:hypothetical protein [Clostridiales bacterium]
MLFRKTTDKHSQIVSFEIITLRTSGMRYTGETEILMKDGKAEVSQYAIMFSQDEDRRKLEKRAICDEQTMLKLLNDCKLLSWDGFKGPHPKGVLDGTIFSLNAVVNGNVKIYASGSENFPKHYRDFTDGLCKILQ